jgi:hypothetical protein
MWRWPLILKKNCGPLLIGLFVNTMIKLQGRGNRRMEKITYEELNDLYSLPNIVLVVKSRRMRWAGHVARMGGGRGAHRVLVGKPEVKRPLGRPRRRWEDNIRRDLQEVGGECGNWMERAQDRDRWRTLVNKLMNFRVP